MNSPSGLAPAEIAQGQLDAYNAQDLDAFCGFYADDVLVGDLNGAVVNDGLASLRDRYAKMFAQFPQNKVELLNRVALAGAVIDHELVIRAPDGDRFEVGVIYTIAGGKIARVDFVK